MRGNQKTWVVLGLALSLAGNAAVAQQASASQAQLFQKREESLAGLLKNDAAEQIADNRRICAAGADPKTRRWARGLGSGSDSLADPSDSCFMVLLRTGRDGALLVFYRQLAHELSGKSDNYQRIPATIGAVVTRGGEPLVSIGGGQGAVVTPALALDAGFTVAYLKPERYAAGMPQAPALKPVAERCLAQAERDLSLCYSVGYAYGVLAVSGLSVTAVSTTR